MFVGVDQLAGLDFAPKDLNFALPPQVAWVNVEGHRLETSDDQQLSARLTSVDATPPTFTGLKDSFGCSISGQKYGSATDLRPWQA